LSAEVSPDLPLGQDFIDELLALCRHEQIELNSHQALLCQRHIELMLRWNRRSNLTRITQPEAILVKHLLDSLLPARWLPERGTAVDVGTGAGFPGVPLKILHPNLRMVLLESHGKKVSFLKLLLAELRLEDLEVLQRRWEEMIGGTDRLAPGSVSLITVRALKLPGKPFAEFAVRGLEPGGTLAYWGVSEGCTDSASALPPVYDLSEFSAGKLQCAGSHEYRLPRNYGTRRLFLWRRQD
jgi:16S rRNA (guanine527-N7)-methyltransferase